MLTTNNGYIVQYFRTFIYIINFAKHESQHDTHMQFKSEYYKNDNELLQIDIHISIGNTYSANTIENIYSANAIEITYAKASTVHGFR